MQGIQSANVLGTQKASEQNSSANTTQQSGSFQGAAVTTIPGQLLPENAEEVGMFKGFYKSLSKRMTAKEQASGSDPSRMQQKVDHAQQISDSMEEAGMGASKFRKKSEVEKTGPENVQSRDGQKTGEDLQKLFSKVRDIDQAKVAESIEQMLRLPHADPAEAMNSIVGKMKDVTHKYLALLEMKQQLKANIEQMSKVKGGESERLNFFSKMNTLCNETLQDLADEEGSSIRAGLNMTEVAMAHAMGKRGGGDVNELRDFYRDYVMNYDAIFHAYKKILKKFKKGGFKKGKKFLMDALLADLDAEGSSISEERLGAIMGDMQALRSIERLHDESDKLFNRLSRKYRIKEDKRLNMAETVLSFFDGNNFRSTIKKKVGSIIKTTGITHLAGNINLLNGVREILTAVPTSLFKTSNERAQIIQAVQAELDVYINKEAESEEFVHQKTKL